MKTCLSNYSWPSYRVLVCYIYIYITMYTTACASFPFFDFQPTFCCLRLILFSFLYLLFFNILKHTHAYTTRGLWEVIGTYIHSTAVVAIGYTTLPLWHTGLEPTLCIFLCFVLCFRVGRREESCRVTVCYLYAVWEKNEGGQSGRRKGSL